VGLSIAQFVQHAQQAEGPAVHVSSMCTVFAESEVISLIGRGEDTRRVALGLHQAIANRLAAMVRRLGLEERLVFTGGGALNGCLQRLLAEELGVSPTVPGNPQTVGALGAALHAVRLRES
jgi:(R)-2-hydroxyacyl-CoA dehydratese activating ATPase